MLLYTGVLIEIPDDFGPAIYKASSSLSEWWQGQGTIDIPIIGKLQNFEPTGQQRWLLTALNRVNEEYTALGITVDDFSLTEREDYWEPIPLDRQNEGLKLATESLDTAIEQIEADNGYAVTAPKEREHTIESLKSAAEILKTKTKIYWTQLKSLAFEPLQRVIIRFGNAAAGSAASAARQALVEWLKEIFERALHWL